MAEESNSTFQKVFSQMSSTDSIKLLPWCVSSAVALHYINEVLATAAQWEEDIPWTATVPDPESSQVLNPPDSPAHHTGIPTPLVPPLLDIPIVGTPLVGHPFAWFIVDPMQKREDCFPSSTLGDLHYKWTHVNPQEVEVRSEHSCVQGEEDLPTLTSEARYSSKPQGQEATSGPSSPTKATTDPDDATVQEPRGVLGIRKVRAAPTRVRPHLTQMHPERMWLTLIWSQPLGIVSCAWTQVR